MKTIVALVFASLFSACSGDFSALQVSYPDEQVSVGNQSFMDQPSPADEISIQSLIVQIFNDPLFQPNPCIH